MLKGYLQANECRYIIFIIWIVVKHSYKDVIILLTITQHQPVQNRHQIRTWKLLKDTREYYQYRITHFVVEILIKKRSGGVLFLILQMLSNIHVMVSLCCFNNSTPTHTKINTK